MSGLIFYASTSIASPSILTALPGEQPGYDRKAKTGNDGQCRKGAEREHYNFVFGIVVHVLLHSNGAQRPTGHAGFSREIPEFLSLTGTLPRLA